MKRQTDSYESRRNDVHDLIPFTCKYVLVQYIAKKNIATRFFALFLFPKDFSQIQKNFYYEN